MMGEHGATVADQRSTVGPNVVLVGSELASLSGDALQFLLGWGIGIANVHEKTFLANRLTMKVVDHIITNVAILKACLLLVWLKFLIVWTYRAKPTPRLLPMLSRRILLDKMV
jgi:hypothetical protein